MKNFRIGFKCFAWIITIATICDLINKKISGFVAEWMLE